MEKQNIIFLNGRDIQVDMSLNAFTIYERPSNTVAYFAIDFVSNRLYVQFASGKGHVYNNVEPKVLNTALNAESIGRYFDIFLVGKFDFVKIDVPLINSVTK